MKKSLSRVIKPFVSSVTLSICLINFINQAARAEVISVNFTKTSVNAQQVWGVSGVEAVENWTNTSNENEASLKDSSGNETTASLYAPASRRDSFSGAPLTNSPMKAGLQFWGTSALPFTLSDIPYSEYKLIVYLTGFNNNNASFVSDGKTTYYWDPKAYSSILTQTTQTDYEEGTTAEKHNYAIFGSEEEPLTEDSITINYGLAPGQTSGGGIGGFQIVQLSSDSIKTTNIRITSFSFDSSDQTASIRFTGIEGADFIIESSSSLDFEDGSIWYPSEGEIDETSFQGQVQFTFKDTTVIDETHFWRVVYP